MDSNAAKLRALARQSRVLARSHVTQNRAEEAYRLAGLYDRQADELASAIAAR